MGSKVDTAINHGKGPYTFRVNGQNYHLMGSLLPEEGKKAKFAQLYIYDTENGVSNRISAISGTKDTKNIDAEIVEKLMVMFDETNSLARAFRMTREQLQSGDVQKWKLKLLTNKANRSQFQLPENSEIAALIPGDLSLTDGKKEIIIESRSNALCRISELHPSYMALQYPILFPYGEEGYSEDIPYAGPEKPPNKHSYVTMREYYAYRIQSRLIEGQTLVSGGRLFQQYIVDAYTTIEQQRLSWVRNNQKQLRAELYANVKDAVSKGDNDPRLLGKRIILPSSFTGGPRYLAENYQDAIAICRYFGNLDLFITITANPKWSEIEGYLEQTQTRKIEDKPDVVCRVFKIKLDQLITDIMKEEHFGAAIAVIYTFEFQKRGLPHAHILVWLHSQQKTTTTKDIDKIICAEIPDKTMHPDEYRLVSNFMIHGPCGEARRNAPCCVEGKYSKNFPKKYVSETTINEDGYAIYRRRDQPERFVIKGNVQLDNRYVVPYNLPLLQKYEAHINVEWCNKSKAIKYLFKYINKGVDRATIILESETTPHKGKKKLDGTPKQVDEIKNYLDCRYVSDCEAIWRIFAFDLHHRSAPVVRLAFHLEGKQTVMLDETRELDDLVASWNLGKQCSPNGLQ